MARSEVSIEIAQTADKVEEYFGDAEQILLGVRANRVDVASGLISMLADSVLTDPKRVESPTFVWTPLLFGGIDQRYGRSIPELAEYLDGLKTGVSEARVNRWRLPYSADLAIMVATTLSADINPGLMQWSIVRADTFNLMSVPRESEKRRQNG